MPLAHRPHSMKQGAGAERYEELQVGQDEDLRRGVSQGHEAQEGPDTSPLTLPAGELPVSEEGTEFC